MQINLAISPCVAAAAFVCFSPRPPNEKCDTFHYAFEEGTRMQINLAISPCVAAAAFVCFSPRPPNEKCDTFHYAFEEG
ncbi:hypothetical protein CDAR_119511 [Caerostris darwini]|uniref:Secreted protein n=1 Tax=Caerostris darwini TaxID=1538125 RepID=A0AAV4SDF5_9ARAC|nr:hypothetical protein CDAR_119511 [Caerostris darwini]